MPDEIERFVEHPTPDRFFQKIGQADLNMEPMGHDEVTFKTQHVPGGRFAVELSARYSYAGRECTQNMTLDRDAAEALHERLGEILDKDPRGDRF